LLQLTDNVTKSSAGAVQEFRQACDNGFFRAKNQRADVALAKYIATNTTDADDDNRPLPPTDDETSKCPKCPANEPNRNQDCCLRGLCHNKTECDCYEGWFYIHSGPAKVKPTYIFAGYI